MISFQFSYGQKTEINLNVYSGLFSFHGDGAASKSSIITSYSFIPHPFKFTATPYGKKSGFSYALEFQAQRLSKRKNIYGLGISFEDLTSIVKIDKIGISGDPAYMEYPASGKTKLENTFITFNPFVGHRYAYHKITFDLLTGLDVAFCLMSKEEGNATRNYTSISTIKEEKKNAKPSIDFRPRIQIKTQINKFGFSAGYSLGLTNYSTQYNSKAFTNFLRLGLNYQLK